MKERFVREYTIEEIIQITDVEQLPRHLRAIDRSMPLGRYRIKAKVEVYRVEEEEE